MKKLTSVIEAHAHLFEGVVRESEVTLDHLERELGVTLPEIVRTFWLEHGSGDLGAAPNAATSISDTLRYRKAAALPRHFVVLEDRGDAGSVFLDTSSSEAPVLWIDGHAAEKVSSGTLQSSEHDHFPTFVAWVEFCIDEYQA